MSERDGMGQLSRQEWLAAGAAIGTSVAAYGVTSDAAAQPNGDIRARPSLNENPLGPSPLAVAIIRDELSSLERYAAGRGDALEAQIAALKGVSPDRVGLCTFRLHRPACSGGSLSLFRQA